MWNYRDIQRTGSNELKEIISIITGNVPPAQTKESGKNGLVKKHQ